MHIQNERNDFEADDTATFTRKRLEESEETLEIIVKYMSAYYKRPSGTKHVADFKFPWKEHQEEFTKEKK